MQVDAHQWQQYQKLEGKLEAAKRDMQSLTRAFVDHRAQTAAETLVGTAHLPLLVIPRIRFFHVMAGLMPCKRKERQ